MERTPHCLIVEDDREISGLLARFLSKHGLRGLSRSGWQGDATGPE